MRRWECIAAALVVSALVAITVTATVAQEEGPAVESPSPVEARLSCGRYAIDNQPDNVLLGPVGGGNLVRREWRGGFARIDIDEVNDPRLAGEATLRQWWDEYVYPGVDPMGIEPAPALVSQSLRIVDEQGSWHGTLHGGYIPGLNPVVGAQDWQFVSLTGAGAYEGLTAALWFRPTGEPCDCWAFVRCAFEMRGLVFPGLPPDDPAEPLSG